MSEGTRSEDYSSTYYNDAHLGGYDHYTWDNDEWRTFFLSVADRIVGVVNPRTVLDVGSARGLLVQALASRNVDAVGIDISEHAVQTAHEDVRDRLRVESATEPLGGPYDLVTCIEVLEHMAPGDAQTGHRQHRGRHRPGAVLLQPRRPRRAHPRQHAPRGAVGGMVRRARLLPPHRRRPLLHLPVGRPVRAGRPDPAHARPALRAAVRRGQRRAGRRSGRRCSTRTDASAPSTSSWRPARRRRSPSRSRRPRSGARRSWLPATSC